MRILCADSRLAGKPHHDWKEGYELMYAFRNLGIHCDIAGPNGLQYTELDIPRIASGYDLILVTENYPEHTWKWWNWGQIRTPKLFWAIDTHVRAFPWLSAFQWVAYNIKEHVRGPKGFWMPYALSTVHYRDPTVYSKIYDTIFIGSLHVSPRRKQLCDRFGIRHMEAYGAEYIKTMKQAKICFNTSISTDINAKYFEIMGSGTFMLTNYNQCLLDFFQGSPDLMACMYKTDEEIGEMIAYYLEHDEEREAIAKRLHDYVWEHHTWESRCKDLLHFVTKPSMKLGFVTFANTAYMRPTRILNEAASFGVFDFIRNVTEHDIPDYIQKHKTFIETNPKGYGFYIWKPKVILDTLATMQENDILVYCDAGMKLNVNGLPRFHEYIEKVQQPDQHLLVFSTNDLYAPQRFVKQDAIMEYFPEFNDAERFKRYYYAGVMILKKTDKTIALLQDYLRLCETETLLDYKTTGTYVEVPSYKGNDGDCSLWNLCLAKHGIHADIYPDETMLYDSAGEQAYDATDWSSLNAYPFQCQRLRPGNQVYNTHRNKVVTFHKGRIKLVQD